MIDEKKIEAIVESNLCIAKELIPDSPIFGYEKELRNLMVACVKKGVELTLEHLWHDASEEPEKDKYILFQYDTTKSLMVRGGFQVVRMVYSDWETYTNNWYINRWFYLEDLFYKQKGDNNE